MAREIKLMADYAAWPLWDPDGNVDPETLPISKVLQHRLDVWAETFDGTVNPDDPRKPRFSAPEAQRLWNEQGRALWHDLRRELGSAYVVCYFSEEQAEMFFPREEDRKASVFQGPHAH